MAESDQSGFECGVVAKEAAPMKRSLSAAAVIVLLAASAAMVQTMAESDADAQDPVTMTGCLRTGSAETVFILRGAATGGAAETPDQQASPRDYLLVQFADGVDLTAHVNHRVAITGIVSRAAGGPAPPEAANTAERAMPRLSVRALKHVAPDCSTPL